MSKFKVGDRVERINCDHFGIKVGGVFTVRQVPAPNDRLGIGLVEIRGTYIESNFKLAPSETDALRDAVEYKQPPEPTIDQLVKGNAELGETIKALEDELRRNRVEYNDVSALIGKMVEPGVKGTHFNGNWIG